MDKIRVLHLIDHLSSGGAQYVLTELLTRFDPAKFQQTVGYFLWDSPYQDLFRELKIEAEKYGGNRPYKGVHSLLDPGILRRFQAHLSAQPFEIIVVHLFVAPVFLRLVKSKVRSARLVYVMHNHLETLNRKQVFGLRWALPIFHRVVSEFPSSSPQLESLGVPPSKIRLIRLGVDEQVYDHSFDADHIKSLRDRFAIGPDRIVLLSVARLNQDKYIDLFIRAFAHVREACPECLLLLVGHGPEEGALRNLAVELGLTDAVRFAGKQLDVKELYGLADLYLAVSAGSSDIGIAATKAMMCGKPVVTVDILDGQTGGSETGPEILVRSSNHPQEFADKILSLIRNENYARNLAQNGYKYVREHHSTSRMAQLHQELYLELLAQH